MHARKARRSVSVESDSFFHPAPLMITVLIILIPLLFWVVKMQMR